MKKLIYSIILLGIIIIPIKKSYAEEARINLSCTPAVALPGDSVSCTIAAETAQLAKDSEFVGKVTLSSNLEMASTTISSKWKANAGNNSTSGVFNLKSTEAQSNIFEIATFTVKIKSDSTENGIITLNTTSFGTSSSINPATQTITMKTNVTDTSDNTSNTPDEDVNVDIKNPETGSNIPFIIIGVGAILVIIFYEIATKKKKIHKI